MMWALLLASVLSAGVVGVLLFTTATQRQAITLSHQQQQVQRLQARTQALQTSLERNADPALLARRAARLHMHPAKRSKWLTGHAARHRSIVSDADRVSGR
jgi:hypothetical protein